MSSKGRKLSPKTKPVAEIPQNPGFQCNICKGSFHEQFEFFEHLRSHYDKEVVDRTIDKRTLDKKGTGSAKRKITPPVKKNLRSSTSTSSTTTPSPSAKANVKVRTSNRKKSVKVKIPVPKSRRVIKSKVLEEPEPELIVAEQTDPEIAPETEDLSNAEDRDVKLGPNISDPNPEAEPEHDLNDSFEPDADPLEQNELKPPAPTPAPYTCHHCFESFSSKRQKILHIKKEHIEESKDGQICATCGTTFLNLKQLNMHMKKEHPIVIIMSPNNDNESQSLAKTDGGSDRISSPTKILECKECSKTFVHKNSLLYHMKKHTGERPYVCDECGKTFLASSALSVHKRLHTGERPFACEHCYKRFRQWGDLAYHKQSIHSNVKAFTCEFCKKTFARKYSLTVHRRIHTGEKGYNCDLCEKSFRASSYLQNHRRIHTGERPHTCDICLKPFRVKSDMKRHRMSHSRTRTYKDIKLKVEKTITLTEIELEQSPDDKEISSAETVTHNLVAVDASGQIIPLEPKIAQQLRAGQVIQVPVTNSIMQPTTLTTGGVDHQGIITYFTGGEAFEENTPDASNTVEVKQDISTIYQPGSIHIVTTGVDGEEVISNTQGTLYVWPTFMS